MCETNKMGMTEISTWVLIRRYDQIDSENKDAPPRSTLRRLGLPANATLDETKSLIYRWIGLEQDGTTVLKIRRHDGNLVPVSALLNGSRKDKPIIIDVVNVHQFCPVQKRNIAPGYIDALKSKLQILEKRVVMAETALPEVANARIRAMEETASQIVSCVSFLDRRLDELAPPDWREQFKSTN